MAISLSRNKFDRHCAFQEKGKGFTVIEMIVAIVVSSIMAIGVVGFIGRAVDGIDSASSRNQLASAGRIAIDRLAMELHNALPNSIRVTPTAGLNATGDQCIEFIPVRAATSYINPPFLGLGSSTFEVVDFTPSQHTVTGGFAVIYPNRQDQVYDGDNGAYAVWPNFASNRPIQEILDIQDSVSADQSTVTLVIPHRFRLRSPSQRFFVADQPVSYCVVADKLYRYSDYGFFAAQVDVEESPTCIVTTPARCLPDYAALSATPPRIKTLITDSVDNAGLTAFRIDSPTLARNALIAIQLNFSSDGDSIILNHEILTRSVP
ncbi:MAG: type II secretion system protein [Pseudohongiella sp.]|nr:type II secretion system protein [Pseudohongiella sp.]